MIRFIITTIAMVAIFAASTAWADASTISISTNKAPQATGNTPCKLRNASVCYYGMSNTSPDSNVFVIDLDRKFSVCFDPNVALATGAGRILVYAPDYDDTDEGSTIVLGAVEGLLGAADQACMYDLGAGRYYFKVSVATGGGVVGLVTIRRQ